MLLLFENKKAQSTMEYALLIAVVIGVFSAMQIYMRRGLQARIKSATDNAPSLVLKGVAADTAIQGDALFGSKTQYEPYYIKAGEYSFNTTSGEGTETGTVTEAGGKKEVSGATVTRTGKQQVTGAKEE